MAEFPRLRDEVLIADLPDGEVVASLGDRSVALVLNPTAGAILELCDGTRSPEDIVGFVCQNLQVSGPDVVRGDVARLLSELTHAGLLV